MLLSATDIRNAFAALSDELQVPEHAEIVIVGGAALVLLLGARESTKDVDAYFVRPEASTLRYAAEAVADRLGLPKDWLNDGAKGYLVGISTGAIVFQSDALTVRTAAIEQLLAMKLVAWRDAVDRADAALLLAQLSGSAEEVWSLLKPFVSPPLMDKASYAFEDLWEATHGAS